MDSRNVSEGGSQRHWYACGHIGINGDSKNAVWDLNEDSAKMQGETGLKAAGVGCVWSVGMKRF